ncbi:hypothetical protein, partial [Gottfriedia solisilvae]
ILDETEIIITKITLSLIKGAKNPDYKGLIPKLPPKMKEIVNLRWEAIIKIFNNQFEEAEDLLLQALNFSKVNRVEKWIKRDILLDLRNLEMVKNNKQNKIVFESQRQKELKKMDKWNYRPILDWSLENALFELTKENYNLHTDTPHTIRFGGTFTSSMNKILNAFNEAILNGSFTFIHIIRERLAYILFSYGKLYSDSRLLLHSLKLFMIEYKVSIVKKILESEWNDLQKEVVDNPSSLIELSVLENNRSEDLVIKCVIIEKFGPYFYDEEINDINVFLKYCMNQEFSMSESLDVKRNAIRAYKDIINRIENEEIIKQVSGIFLEDNHLINDEILKLFNKVQWKKVKYEICKDLAFNLYRKKEDANNSSEIYSTLLNMKNAHPGSLVDIEIDMKKQWEETKSLDINNYFSLQSSPNSLNCEMVKDLIEKIKVVNKNMTNGSSISFGGYSLYHLLANHLMNLSQFSPDLANLFVEILCNPYQSTTNKQECLDCIIRLIKYNEKFVAFLNNKKIGFILQEKISQVLISRGDEIFDKSGQEKLELKLYELLILIDITPKNINDILAKCVEFGTHPFVGVREDALSLVVSISKHYGNTYKNEVIQFLYSKTFDNWYKLKGDSLYYLCDICEAEWENIILNRMFELIDDNNSYVRSSVIVAAQKKVKSSKGNKKYKDMLAILKRDRHYKLREQVGND